jgi:hypothetical protein
MIQYPSQSFSSTQKHVETCGISYAFEKSLPRSDHRVIRILQTRYEMAKINLDRHLHPLCVLIQDLHQRTQDTSSKDNAVEACMIQSLFHHAISLQLR